MLASFSNAEEPLGLSDCLRLAFKNNNLLKVADLGLVLANEKADEIKAQKWPLLNMNAAYTRVGKVTSFTVPMGPGGAQQTFSFGTPNRMNLDVRMQLALFTWGRITGIIGLSKYSMVLATEQKKLEKLNLTDQVLRAYHAVVLNMHVINLHKSNVQRTEKYQSAAEKRFNNGQSSKLELLRAQVQAKNAQSSLAEAKDNLKKSYIFLAKVVNVSDSLLLIKGALQDQSLNFKESEVLASAWNNRVELHLLAAQQEMTKKSLQIAKSGNKPNLGAFSSYNVQNGFDPMDPERFVDNWNIGMQLTIPLFDGFATRHKVQQSRLEFEKIQLQEQELRDFISMQIKQSFVSLHQAEEKIDALRENIILAKEALHIAETQYESGVVSSLEVIDAEQTLIQSELSNSQAIFNHIMAKLELCKAMGDYRLFSEVVSQ